MYQKRLKRFFDFTLSLLGLVLFFPVIVILVLIIRYRLGTPFLFTQQRPGHLGKPFTIYKFRTMTSGCDAHGNLLPDAERLTTLGKFLRSSSLDELPELYNVLRGEMSLVGPRPLLMQYLDRYTPEQARRHDMRPGITGWAQVNGRNSISWEQKFDYDLWYIDNYSLVLDIKIILLTVWKVFRRENINEEGMATVTFFGDVSNKEKLND